MTVTGVLGWQAHLHPTAALSVPGPRGSVITCFRRPVQAVRVCGPPKAQSYEECSRVPYLRADLPKRWRQAREKVPVYLSGYAQYRAVPDGLHCILASGAVSWSTVSTSAQVWPDAGTRRDLLATCDTQLKSRSFLHQLQQPGIVRVLLPHHVADACEVETAEQPLSARFVGQLCLRRMAISACSSSAHILTVHAGPSRAEPSIDFGCSVM